MSKQIIIIIIVTWLARGNREAMGGTTCVDGGDFVPPANKSVWESPDIIE